jgi:hypothetical protein
VPWGYACKSSMLRVTSSIGIDAPSRILADLSLDRSDREQWNFLLTLGDLVIGFGYPQ